MNAEQQRLKEDKEEKANWRLWGPFLSERQWGTVREDHSDHGNSWAHFTHDQARSTAYRWGEDGLQGWSDDEGLLCFAPALWNGKDPILKERLFGLGGHEGNHGEDVKESYFYLDSTPTHSYTKALYKYPQREFPYVELLTRNRDRGKQQSELSLADIGGFDEGRYFDVVQEVAKRSPADMLWRITVTNHGPEAAELHLLPTLWFRNIWGWGETREKPKAIPDMRLVDGVLRIGHGLLGRYLFHVDSPNHAASGAEWWFTENESRVDPLTGEEREVAKDGFHRRLIDGEVGAVSRERAGTKAAAHFVFVIPAGKSVEVRGRLHSVKEGNGVVGLAGFDECFERRKAESDAFYQDFVPSCSAEEQRICRQGYAGLLWTKQFYHYIVEDWLEGDPEGIPAPHNRMQGRNADWPHLYAKDVLSMPDKWEYPWFAAWDTAFHMLPFSVIDPEFAKSQLLLLLREWYMHPNGQLPAYEWNFSDVNPPVHAWSVWRVYKITGKRGVPDILFLERAFQKLLVNFTWWVNRKDEEGRHVFGGGFLGLDNIGVFDRSHALPGGGRLHQADGTGWMAGYCLTMLSIALELALQKPAYEDIASKFFEHFISITDAMNSLGGTGLWDDEDGFYYDQLIVDHQDPIPLKIRSLVGLLPLCAVSVLKQETIDALPGFRKRMDWFLIYRKDILKYIQVRRARKGEKRGLCMLAVPSEQRFRKVLGYLLDENEFLSPYGIRSLSKAHEEEPFVFEHGGKRHEVPYTPGEAQTDMFGGNSNWRGPIWFPTNFLILEALEKYHWFHGDSFKVEYPTGSGKEVPLREVAMDLCDRLIALFMPDKDGRRPCFGEAHRYAEVEHWKNLVLFHEYFHGETGEGLGASHQTGWTALVVKIIRHRREKLVKMGEEDCAADVVRE
ncbi:MAG: MGH1-like glycoside hydrolase domain-containing protein [Verrucomicrobiota bacterium JB025]|nr:glucosidase [Verrucomicrobiota bacterium JB025]